MSNAACNKLNSSFSYTIFFVIPYEFNGFPRKLKTAWVFTSRDLVIEPEAESPSVINKVLSKLLGFLASVKCTRQSRSFLLCKLAFLARSLANLRIPDNSLRSRSAWRILRKSKSATSGFLCKKLSNLVLIKSLTNVRTDGPFGPISVEPNLVVVCDSNTGSYTLTEMAEK